MEMKWKIKNFNDDERSEAIKELNSSVDLFCDKWKNNPSYLTNAIDLKAALDDYEKIVGILGTGNELFYHAWLNFSLNQSSPEAKAILNQMEEANIVLVNKINFFVIRLSGVSNEKQTEFLSSDILSDYKHFLEKTFNKSKYLLSEEAEKILNLKSQTSYSFWVNMVEGIFSKEKRKVLNDSGEEVEANFSDILKLHRSSNKTVRDSAGKAFNDILEHHKDVNESQINALIFDKKIEDDLRGFDRPDKSRHISDDINSKVVDTLVSSVSKNFQLSKEYYKLISKMLKVDKIKYYERNLNLIDINRTFSYSESYDLIHRIFSETDALFGEIFEQMHKNGQVDVFPSVGKRSGAFCINGSNKGKVFVLLNHSENFEDVLTIAHEFGHAINAELMKKENNLNYDVPKSTAEVASTFMEDLVLSEMIKSSEGKEKLYFIMQSLERFVSTVFRQVAFYNFETELHKMIRTKGYLSIEEINNLFVNNLKNYMGENVDLNDAGLWWEYIPHFRDYFYVYSYASGILIAKSMSDRLKENPSFINEVKRFLSTGMSKSPEEIFKEMGINILDENFWERGIAEFKSLLAEAQDLVDKYY